MELINWLVSLCSKSVKKTLRRVIIFVSPSYLLFTACFLKNITCQVLEKNSPRPSRTVHPEASFLYEHPCTLRESRSRKESNFEKITSILCYR